MAWLYKRGETWWVRYRVGGQQFLRSTKTGDKAQAEQALAEVETLMTVRNKGSLIDELYHVLTGTRACPASRWPRPWTIG